MKFNSLLYSFFIVAAFTLLGTGCSDDDASDATQEAGTFEIKYDARVGGANLQLNTDRIYTNENGDDFNITAFKYYISNVKLLAETGTDYIIPANNDGTEGYFLIDESIPSSTNVQLNNIPAGTYTGVEFTIGVDADRIEEGAQAGPLDPVNEMFWSWNTGWIFVKFEGTSSASTEDGNEVVYHVGGYKDEGEHLRNNIRSTVVNFHSPVQIGGGASPSAHIMVDVLELFKGATNVDFASNSVRHSPATTTDLADNFTKAFIFDHMHE